jgi:molybdopterin-guanine dinucleotide biosynthesis protein A
MQVEVPMDVVITAGDRIASRPVLGSNKAFLPIAGIPVIHYVLSAVERTRCASRIFVVGNKARLEQLLRIPHSPFRGLCPLQLIEQGDTLYDNVWTAFLHSLPEYTPGTDWRRYLDTDAVDKAVLVMPGDIPLATPAEIDEFVEACDLLLYDYCLGLTAEQTLRAYYPQDGRPGIRMAYFTTRDRLVRHNNLHLVKPLRFGNRHYIPKIYEMRYQREWRNIIRVCWNLWRARDISPRIFWAFLSLHLAGGITRLGWQHVPLFRPFCLDLSLLASLASQLLRTRFTTVTTHYGGCALDIDNAEHYEAISTNFERWIAHQHAIADELKHQL